MKGLKINIVLYCSWVHVLIVQKPLSRLIHFKVHTVMCFQLGRLWVVFRSFLGRFLQKFSFRMKIWQSARKSNVFKTCIRNNCLHCVNFYPDRTFRPKTTINDPKKTLNEHFVTIVFTFCFDKTILQTLVKYSSIISEVLY